MRPRLVVIWESRIPVSYPSISGRIPVGALEEGGRSLVGGGRRNDLSKARVSADK